MLESKYPYASSIEEFIKCIDKIRMEFKFSNKNEDPWDPWFRGHMIAEWELIPKLYRGNYLEIQSREIEDEIREEFITRAPILSEAKPSDAWEWYFLMQHSGAPTRLLDWTDGALLALYFAVKESTEENDAAVWVLDPWALNKASIPAEIDAVITPSACGVTIVDKKKISRWLPKNFTAKGKLPEYPVAIYPTHIARRISGQRSCFTIHGRNQRGFVKLMDIKCNCLKKIIIPRLCTAKIRRDLSTCGIDEATIFPDLDGLGRAVGLRWRNFLIENVKKGTPQFKDALIEIGPSDISDVGVFAVQVIKKGKVVALGINEDDYDDMVTWKDYDNLSPVIQNKIMDFCIGTPEGFIPPEDYDFHKLSVEWYINHSCDDNIGFNDDGDFVATKLIKKGEELTYDYGLAESNPKFSMKCECGSNNCRHLITGNDWKDHSFRQKNLAHMLPKLRIGGI
jgi:hypothetical protein